jgi:hypothetical protein
MKTKVAVIVALLLSVVIAYAWFGVFGYTYKQQIGIFMPTGVYVQLDDGPPVENFVLSGDTTAYEISSVGLILGHYYSHIHAWKSDEWEGDNYNGFTWGGGIIQRNVVLQIMP